MALSVGTTKRCSRCGETRPLDEFSVNRATKDGLQAQCKYCNAEHRAKKRVKVNRTRDGKAQVYFRGPNHGQSRTPLYRVWKGMRERCGNPKSDNYRWYGGKGISVCPEWSEDFLAFKEWSEANGYEPGMQIDRKDSDGDYTPANCRWVTRVVNLRNRSVYLPVELEAQVAELAEATGITKSTLITEAVRAYVLEHGSERG